MRGEQDPGRQVLRAAQGWIGTPYQHQASCKGAGADCLGLIRGIWRELVGPEPGPVRPYTADWAEACGREDLWQAAAVWLRPKGLADGAIGDVLLFRIRESGLAKHLGVQSQIGAAPRFIHAYAGHRVCETALSLPWARRLAARFSFPPL